MRKELEQMKSTLAENQGSSDTILTELQKAKADLAAALAANEALRGTLAAGREKQAAPTGEGTLVTITPDIIPARPLNLNRVTPKAKKVDRGVVVVNVLVSENGDVLDAPAAPGAARHRGSGWTRPTPPAWTRPSGSSSTPARAADKQAKVRVWQGVGFMLD